MIISRTPYRVSFFGGGTDYHTWYQEHGGSVLSTTINHYCYISCRYLPPFFKHKFRISWSKIEEVVNYSEIEHPAVKAVLDYLSTDRGVEISHQGDLPARSGLGSSSTFTVGLINALSALRGEMSSKKHLACEAVHIERDALKENVGVQDQIAAAYGGLNKITIMKNGEFNVEPVILPQEKLENLQRHFLLFFTGVSRTASHIAGEKIKAIPKKQNELHKIQNMVDQAMNILLDGNMDDLGELLHESWMLKKNLSSGISPGFIDDIYARAKKAGAIGGKVLGAGGGGFMLFYAKPENHEKLLQALSDLLLVPFEFETGGSQIIFYDNLQYSQISMQRRDFMHLRNYNGNDNAHNRNDEKTVARERKSRLTLVT